MNCKPGDLAIVVHCLRGVNLGRLVEVLRAYDYHTRSGPRWWIKGVGSPLRYSDGPREGACPDAWLRPIRDGEQPDELLTRIGKPEGVPA